MTYYHYANWEALYHNNMDMSHMRRMDLATRDKLRKGRNGALDKYFFSCHTLLNRGDHYGYHRLKSKQIEAYLCCYQGKHNHLRPTRNTGYEKRSITRYCHRSSTFCKKRKQNSVSCKSSGSSDGRTVNSETICQMLKFLILPFSETSNEWQVCGQLNLGG